MPWENNQTIRFRFGAVALWNLLNKRVIDLRDPTLQLIKTSYERMVGVQAQISNEFEDMTARELPTTSQNRRIREEQWKNL